MKRMNHRILSAAGLRGLRVQRGCSGRRLRRRERHRGRGYLELAAWPPWAVTRIVQATRTHSLTFVPDGI